MNQELRAIWLAKTGRPMRNRQWNCTMDLGRVYARAWGTVRAIWNARKTSYHRVRKSTYYCTTYTTLLPTTTTITLWWGQSWIRSLEQISPLRSAENGQTIFIWVIGVSRYRKYCKAQKKIGFSNFCAVLHTLTKSAPMKLTTTTSVIRPWFTCSSHSCLFCSFSSKNLITVFPNFGILISEYVTQNFPITNIYNCSYSLPHPTARMFRSK